MQTEQTLKTLRQLSAQAKMIKAVVKLTVAQARILLSEDTIHEMQDLTRDLGADVATIEQYLASFGLVRGFGKFAVVNKEK